MPTATLTAEHFVSVRFQINHWRGICEVLQENGAELMIAKVPATSSAAQRAEILMAAIEEKFPGREVNLVAHSMVRIS